MTNNSTNQPPLRILQVLTVMNRGGAESMIMNYYRNIDRSLVQFDFLLHRKEKGAFDNEIIALGGKIFKLEPIHPFNYFRYKKELDTFFKEHPEYKIVHSHLNALSFIVLGSAKRSGIKIRIAHSHTSIQRKIVLKLFEKDSEKSTIVKELIQHLIRFKVRNVSTINFACGQAAGRWLFGDKRDFSVLNNAVDAFKFNYDQDKRLASINNLGLNGKITIGHVGRFSEEKNHFYLINVFNELLKTDSNYHLILIGDGSLRPRVNGLVDELRLTDHVSFLGIREDIPEILQAMDVFVFPSIYEGLPVTLIEAQASGLKIFASSNITKEVDITGLISFLNINECPGIWAKIIREQIPYSRMETFQNIKDNHYDIHENARKLQSLYLNQIK